LENCHDSSHHWTIYIIQQWVLLFIFVGILIYIGLRATKMLTNVTYNCGMCLKSLYNFKPKVIFCVYYMYTCFKTCIICHNTINRQTLYILVLLSALYFNTINLCCNCLAITIIHFCIQSANIISVINDKHAKTFSIYIIIVCIVSLNVIKNAVHIWS